MASSSTEYPLCVASGHCPTCLKEVKFIANDSWYRDSLLCSNCGSIPRERALMAVIEQFFPCWRSSIIHESSPGHRGASTRLKNECSEYIPSQYYADHQPGTFRNGHRCENLEQLSFLDSQIDLHITQDVLEHVFHPDKVFREIARTLKPGGMHICTVPLVNKHHPSVRRAEMIGSQIVHRLPAQWHGNPIGDGRALVTMDWGFDICSHIFEASGLFTHIVHMNDLSQGIQAEYIEVLVTVKPGSI